MSKEGEIHSAPRPLDELTQASGALPKSKNSIDSISKIKKIGFSKGSIEKAIAKLPREGGTLNFLDGTWEINDDLTIPDKTEVRIEHGTLIKIGTKKATGTISSLEEPCQGTLSVQEGSTLVEGKDTDFSRLKVGQFIICNGQRREIRRIISKTQLEVWKPFQTTVHRAEFTKATYFLKGSGTKFDTELEVGDFLYVGQEKLVVTSISGPDSLTVVDYPLKPFSAQAFSRGIRVKIEGSLDAGLYKIFTGPGVVKFAPGAVTTIHPEWWGAKGNKTNSIAQANSDAIEKAIHSMGPDKQAVIEFAQGTYKINRSIVMVPGTYLRGQGMGHRDTIIEMVAHANCHIVKDSPRISGQQASGIAGILFNHGRQDAGYNGLHFTNNTKLWQIENCTFVSYTEHPGGYAIYLDSAAEAWVRGNFIYGYHNGIYAWGYDSYYLNNEIAAGGDYAIYMIGDGNVVQGNIIFGDSGCKTGIYTKTSPNTSIIGNRIGPFDNGIVIGNGGGIIEGNVIIGNRIHGIFSEKGVSDALIINNRIVGNKSYGLAFTGWCVNTIIKNNIFQKNGGPGPNPHIRVDTYTHPTNYSGQVDEPLVEDNAGVDLQSDYPLLPSGNTPNIRMARRWKTANKQPVTITDFLGGCKGKEILVVFGDEQTTLKFSGDSKLRGHGGQDWRPSPGDHLRAVKGDDGYWYCECFETHFKKQ